MSRLLLLPLVLTSLALTAPATAKTPRELAQALNAERLGLAKGEATIAMELRDRAGRIVSRTIRARTASDGGRRRMRLTFLAPSDQKGVELLVVSEPGASPLQYLWLPRSNELRRVAASDREGSFQGSDFSFSDFEDRDLSKATITLVGEETIGGLVAAKLEITGAGGTWTKVTAWIAKDAEVPLRVDFERAGSIARRLEVKRLQSVDGRLVPTRLVMSDLARGTKTTLDISGLAPSATFPDAIFQPEALGR